MQLATPFIFGSASVLEGALRRGRELCSPSLHKKHSLFSQCEGGITSFDEGKN